MHEWQNLIDELTNDLIPLVNEQASIAQNALRKGEGDIQTVFRTREKQLQLAAARLDALREFHLARIRHESASGIGL
jgi:cobalt-zinc-cadmium efflux system outer membrane protein